MPPIDEPTSGMEGPAGPAGPSGAAGVNAYTTTTANFTQPAANATVQIAVAIAAWMIAGQAVYVAGGGYYTVVSVDDATHATIRNSGASGNAAPGGNIVSGAGVGPAGNGASSGFPTVASVLPASADSPLVWAFDEQAGTTIHNYGTAGDSAATQLTLSGTYAQGVGTPWGTGLFVNGGGALGAAAQEFAGSLSVHYVWVPYQVGAYLALFGKAYAVPNQWAVDPFRAVCLECNVNKADGGVARAGVFSSASITQTPLLNQVNLASLLWDAAGGLATFVLNGCASQVALASGSVDWGAHGNWFAGRNPITTDPTYGVILRAMVETTLRDAAWCAARYKQLVGAAW